MKRTLHAAFRVFLVRDALLDGVRSDAAGKLGLPVHLDVSLVNLH